MTAALVRKSRVVVVRHAGARYPGLPAPCPDGPHLRPGLSHLPAPIRTDASAASVRPNDCASPAWRRDVNQLRDQNHAWVAGNPILPANPTKSVCKRVLGEV